MLRKSFVDLHNIASCRHTADIAGFPLKPGDNHDIPFRQRDCKRVSQHPPRSGFAFGERERANVRDPRPGLWLVFQVAHEPTLKMLVHTFRINLRSSELATKTNMDW